MKKLIIASVLSGIVMFFWGFVSWTVLSWHQDVSHAFSDEKAMGQVLKQQSAEAGIYFMPFTEEGFSEGQATIFAAVVPEYKTNMSKQMGLGLLGYIVSGFLVALMLAMTQGLNYGQRLKFVALTGLAIGFIGHFPYYNWFAFSLEYTLVMIADSIIGWVLGGLLIAKFVEGKAG